MSARAGSGDLTEGGSYERVFVAELEPGDVNVWEHKVVKVETSGPSTVQVTWDRGPDEVVVYYGNRETTVLIEKN